MARYSRSISSDTSVSSASSQRQRNWRNSCDEQDAKLKNLEIPVAGQVPPNIRVCNMYISFLSVLIEQSLNRSLVSHRKCKNLNHMKITVLLLGKFGMEARFFLPQLFFGTFVFPHSLRNCRCKLFINLMGKKPSSNAFPLLRVTGANVHVEFALRPIPLFALAPSVKQHSVQTCALGSVSAL